ncbi:MAG TPA: T9SS type A sorting domain-containing protein [Bacteroidetes bacterium]|nr:T9SS type A sorting domain-containing protein [Bacteroidota bacterium]
MENVPHATLKIEVFNLLGEQVYSNDMAGGLVNTPIRLDLSNLASGQYLLKIMAGTQLLVKRIVVESD